MRAQWTANSLRPMRAHPTTTNHYASGNTVKHKYARTHTHNFTEVINRCSQYQPFQPTLCTIECLGGMKGDLPEKAEESSK